MGIRNAMDRSWQSVTLQSGRSPKTGGARVSQYDARALIPHDDSIDGLLQVGGIRSAVVR
jgi:hypothetical protein